MRETHRLVIEHIRRVRQIRNLEDCTIVLCLESNLAFEAQVKFYANIEPLESQLTFECLCLQHIVHAIQGSGMKRWIALQEGAGNTLGWLTVSSCPVSLALPQY